MVDKETSDQRFSIGDIAIVIDCFTNPSLNGREVTIISGLRQWQTRRNGERYMGYGTDLAEKGIRYAFRPSQLRKKRPPREDLQVVRWAQCPWQPEQVRA